VVRPSAACRRDAPAVWLSLAACRYARRLTADLNDIRTWQAPPQLIRTRRITATEVVVQSLASPDVHGIQPAACRDRPCRTQTPSERADRAIAWKSTDASSRGDLGLRDP